MLLDIGNSDGLWLFQNKFHQLAAPFQPFDEELGKGLNGNVTGIKGSIESASLGPYTFKLPLISIPDSISIRHLDTKNNRKGSIGNELLRRFTIILDYPNKGFYYKPNRNLKDPFHYNRSGITIIHSALEWKREQVGVRIIKGNSDEILMNYGKDIDYEYVLKSKYMIESVRKNSNAEKAGLKPLDRIVSLNKRKVDNMTLNDIDQFMLEHEFKEITIEIERNKTVMKINFILDIPYEN